MLDKQTLEWVLSTSAELQNKIWDLREAIHIELEKINSNEPKQKISLHRPGSRRNGIQKNGHKVSLDKALSSCT